MFSWIILFTGQMQKESLRLSLPLERLGELKQHAATFEPQTSTSTSTTHLQEKNRDTVLAEWQSLLLRLI